MKTIVDALCEGDAAPEFDVPKETEEVQLAKDIIKNLRGFQNSNDNDRWEQVKYLQAIEDAANQLIQLHAKPTASPKKALPRWPSQWPEEEERRDFRERHAAGDPTAIALGEQ